MASAVLAAHAGQWKSNEHYLEAYARALGYRSRAELRRAPVDEVQTRENAAIARLVQKLNAETSLGKDADKAVKIMARMLPPKTERDADDDRKQRDPHGEPPLPLARITRRSSAKGTRRGHL